MSNYKVAICGYGWVGKAMHKLFPEAFIYSRGVVKHDGKWFKGRYGEWAENYDDDYKKQVNKCDVAFICVPTPNKLTFPPIQEKTYTDKENIMPELEPKLYSEDKLDTSIVEEVIKWCECPLLVVRSTVNPGDCDRWRKKYKKDVVMQPEYLGETPNHPLLDTVNNPFLIIGSRSMNNGSRKLIELYQTVYNANVNIRQVTNLEAEIIKLSENRAIAFKVAQCQELYDVCQEAGVDYYTIREAVYSDDPRLNLWWSFVFPDKRGFNSKCIPKDIYAWCAWAESCGYEPKITRAILEKNKEWIDEA
jgi:UDPglucose 6-dehydrogenase|tara:strand:+ start:2731 stop:3645 length:915 start_codon:yes stop_codon:yes gene_type:complete